MKLVPVLVGLAALSGVALSTGGGIDAGHDTGPGLAGFQQADYVCNAWGHCWRRPTYGDGYYHPTYLGGWAGDAGTEASAPFFSSSTALVTPN
jgi:hypothetical protein